jgi:hypothetical protein
MKAFIEYFSKQRFGTIRPVLTTFSCLPPKDRCVILNELKSLDIFNRDIYEKLALAYIKDGKIEDAFQMLKTAHQNGFLTSEHYILFKDKIEFLNNARGGNFGSAVTYPESLILIEKQKKYAKELGIYEQNSEFCEIMIDYCERKMSS